jgi:DnaJ-domain-containing protein 1
MNLPGRLRTTTLGDLLGALHRARATGTLELGEDSGRTHRVHLSVGLVVAVEIDGATSTLGEILKREHGVDDEVLRRSLLRAISSQRLHGDVLVSDFRIGDVVVDAALRQQIWSRLERLEQLPDARVLFRVTLRPPRGALTDAPLAASHFLTGRRRARDRAGQTPRPERTRPYPRSDSLPEALSARPDPYPASAWRVLGVPADADPSEIKRAYRRLARSFHPDSHPSASEEERRVLARRFQAVTEAYRALVA